MMDEKKVREAIKHLLKKKIALEHKYPRDSNGKIAPNKEYDDVLRSYRIAIEALEKQLAKNPIEVNDAYPPKVGEFRNWIPVEDTDHTPENESYVLVSFSNFNVPDIARYEENEEGGTYYPGDDEESYLKYGIFVNAWMPLPKPYRPDFCHGCFGAANNDCGICSRGGRE